MSLPNTAPATEFDEKAKRPGAAAEQVPAKDPAAVKVVYPFGPQCVRSQ